MNTKPVYSIRRAGAIMDPCKYEVLKDGRFMDYVGSKWGARRIIRRDMHPGPELVYDEGEG